MKTLLVLLLSTTAHAGCLKEGVTFRLGETTLSVARAELPGYHHVFRFGESCVSKNNHTFTVTHIDGELVIYEFMGDTAYHNECPGGVFVMLAEQASELCRAEATAAEEEFLSDLASPAWPFVRR